MNFLNFDIKKLLIFLFVISLPLLSINMQQKALSHGWYDRPFSFLASIAQASFFTFSDGVRANTSLYLNLVNIKMENQKLKQANQELLSRLEAHSELQKENDRLNELLGFKAKSKMDLLAARVMSKDMISNRNTIQINKGSNHGLKAGQAVIAVGGAVGYILKAEALTSLVLLMTDPYSVIDGIISRSRSRGIVEGKNAATCSLKYVEKSEDVQPGDLVITSGLDNIFPKGFPVAVVESVETKAFAVSLKVELKPTVDPDKIEEVFVILNAANEDFSEQASIK